MEKLTKEQVEELLAACRAGKESGWRDLFRQFYPLARWVATSHLSAERAEDIAQETMIALCAAINAGTVRNVPGFVRTVAHNKCVDYLRKKEPLDHRVPNHDSDEDQEDELSRIAAPSEIPLALAEEEALTALRRYLAEFGDPCASLLKQSYLERKPYNELAAVLSIPVAQVGMKIRRCREKFKLFLEKQRPAFFAEVAEFYPERNQGGRYAT